MKPNVFITVRQQGKLAYRWEGHNTWTDVGRDYLRRVCSLNTIEPDTPTLYGSHLKHVQFGVGGVLQGTVPAQVDTSYPAGFDPNATSGKEYNHELAVSPPIGTLERPVRISGGSNPYASAAASDVWLTDHLPPKTFFTYPSTSSFTVWHVLAGGAGDVAYAPFGVVPLSEAGLVVGGTADVHEAYNAIVAYVNFTPIQFDSSSELTIGWTVNF